jgi:hypothetical protein
MGCGATPGCLSARTVRRPLRPFWRPFSLRFTYVTSVLVKKYLDATDAGSVLRVLALRPRVRAHRRRALLRQLAPRVPPVSEHRSKPRPPTGIPELTGESTACLTPPPIEAPWSRFPSAGQWFGSTAPQCAGSLSRGSACGAGTSPPPGRLLVPREVKSATRSTRSSPFQECGSSSESGKGACLCLCHHFAAGLPGICGADQGERLLPAMRASHQWGAGSTH